MVAVEDSPFAFDESGARLQYASPRLRSAEKTLFSSLWTATHNVCSTKERVVMWNKINAIPGRRFVRPPSPYAEMLLIPAPPDKTREASFWLIGQYKDQTSFASDLRTSKTLQNFVTDCRVRFGLRETDRPPFDMERRKRYGATLAGANSGGDFTSMRVRSLAQPVRPGIQPVNRISDQKENVRLFWMTQTPQSHHIVEFNHLRDLGKSRDNGLGEMDHGQLPCVLLAAEFHQRYISSILKQTHGWTPEQLRAGLGKVYSSIYLSRGTLFSPLWTVSKIILRAAEIPV